MRARAIVAFLILSFGAFWLATPLAAVSSALPLLAAAIAPGLVAVLVVATTDGGGGVRALLGTLARWRVRPGWYLAAIGIPVAAGIAAAGCGLALGSTPRVDLAGVLPLAPVIVLFAAGEELGWRGFLLPQLLGRMPVIPTALVLGVIHAAYHAPLWVAAAMPAPAYSFVSFSVTSLAFGVLFTWLYLGTARSVLLTTLFHGSINVAGNAFFGGMPSGRLDWLLPLSYWAFAVAVIAWTGTSLVRPPVPVPRQT
jgi:membrane protease YdiL (CAAX protease family)